MYKNRQMDKPAARWMDEWKATRMRFPGLALATYLRHLFGISCLVLLAASESHVYFTDSSSLSNQFGWDLRGYTINIFHVS